MTGKRTGRPPGRPRTGYVFKYTPRELTPGWVVRCECFMYPPTTDRTEAERWYELASTHGCKHEHEIADVLIYADGVHYRYVQREERAS